MQISIFLDVDAPKKVTNFKAIHPIYMLYKRHHQIQHSFAINTHFIQKYQKGNS